MIAGVALRAPALSGALLNDDWDHFAMQKGIYPVPVPAWDMFNFVGGNQSARDALLMSGRLPWWSSPDLHLAVFRPLSSWLVYLDFAVLHGHQHPERMHVHSFIWWLLLLGSVATLFRRVLPAPAALFALALYTVDDAHVYPVAWVANRSEIISIALVVWGMCAHVAAEHASRRALLRFLATLMVGAGLLAGEHAFAPLCYLLAFEVLRDEAGWESRLLNVMPYLFMAGAYIGIRAAWGYGVAGSAFYIDPVAEPLRYARTAATRIPLLIGDLTFGVPAEWWYWGPPWQESKTLKGIVPKAWLTLPVLKQAQVVVGLLAVTLCTAVQLWLLRARNKSSRRTLSWLILGALVSLIPLAGTASMSRLTVAPAIGFSAALGYLAWRVATAILQGTGTNVRIVAAALLLSIVQLHGVRAATLSYDGSQTLSDMSRRETHWVTHGRYGRKDLSYTHIFILSAHDMATQYCLPYAIATLGLAPPLSSHLLSPAAANSHKLRRIADNQLEIEFPDPVQGDVFSPMVYRSENHTFYRGQRFPGVFFDVDVTAVRGGVPQRLLFTFRAPLDNPYYLFIYPTEDGLRPLRLPAVGRSVSLDAPAWPQ